MGKGRGWAVLSRLPFHTGLGVLTSEARLEKETKGIQGGKGEIKLPVLADGMAVYEENSRESTIKFRGINMHI